MEEDNMGTRRLEIVLLGDFMYKSAKDRCWTGMVHYEGEHPLYSISQLMHARHLAIMHELENWERIGC
jgi:hypothetical protein